MFPVLFNSMITMNLLSEQETLSRSSIMVLNSLFLVWNCRLIPHYAMPVRALLYDGLGYLKECNEFRNIHKAEHDFDSDTGFLSGMNKSDKIHPIITLIFYYGESPWDGPVTLSGMMTDIPEELRPFFSDYKINLVQILDSGHYQFYNEDVRSVFDITQKIYTKNLQ